MTDETMDTIDTTDTGESAGNRAVADARAAFNDLGD
jgi:hypothetical protein